MAKFTTTQFLCNVSRPTKLYKSPYDTVSTNTVIYKNQKFISDKQYQMKHVTMFHITRRQDADVPVGMWCPSTVLQLIPIESEPEAASTMKPDGTTDIQKEFQVKAFGAIIYQNPTGDRTVPSGLNLGDTIHIDQVIHTVSNGHPEVRYHIASLTSEDQTLVNGWIVENKAIREVIPEVEPVSFDNLIMPTAAVPTPGTGGGGTGGSGNTSNNPTTTVTPDNNDSGTTITLPATTDEGENVKIDISFGNFKDPEVIKELYEVYDFDYNGSTEESLMGVPIGRMLFVHGMPFQFTHITDRRLHGNDAGKSDQEFVEVAASGGSADMYGRTFAKEIAGNMPIAVIVPGKPKFLTNITSGIKLTGDDRKDAIAGLLPGMATNDGTALEGVVKDLVSNVNGDYQYYSLEVNTEEYFQYVDSLAHPSARFMGIGKMTYRGKSLEDLHWADYNSAADQEYGMFEEVVGIAGGVSFAYDPLSAVSDSISSSTGESKFASYFNNINSQAREIEFIMGYSGFESNAVNSLIESGNFVQNAQDRLREGGFFAGIGNAIDRVGSWLSNSLHGMNMRFPEIWNESTHTRSYDIEMHFITPYATQFCKWRYVLVPFYHVFCLAAPKSDTNVSQYSSPFIIRAYSKGYFNVELGIIENLTWKRFGDGDMIAEDGVPTQIDVEIQFKDLYHALAMTNMYNDQGNSVLGNNIQNFFNNTGLVDLIGTLSGVNMNRIDLRDRLAMWASDTLDVYGSKGGNFMRHIQGRVRSVVENILYGV